MLLLLQQRLFRHITYKNRIGKKPNVEHMYLFPTPCRVSVSFSLFLYVSGGFLFVFSNNSWWKSKNHAYLREIFALNTCSCLSRFFFYVPCVEKWHFLYHTCTPTNIIMHFKEHIYRKSIKTHTWTQTRALMPSISCRSRWWCWHQFACLTRVSFHVWYGLFYTDFALL